MGTLKAVLVPAVLAASLAFAQAPAKLTPAARVQHRVNFLTTLLTLNAAQQQQALKILTAATTSEALIEPDLKSAHDRLRSAVQINDNNGIQQSAAAIGNLTEQLTVAEAKANAAFFQILTPDQQTKLTQFESQDHGQFGNGGGPRGLPGRPH